MRLILPGADLDMRSWRSWARYFGKLIRIYVSVVVAAVLLFLIGAWIYGFIIHDMVRP